MEENEFDLLPVIKELIDGYKHLADEIAEVKTTVMDNLISPLNEAYEKEQYDNALSDFRCKYAEKLEPFGDKLKAIEGEDFDIIKKTFDDFTEDNKGYEEAEYVEELSKSIQSQLDTIGKAFGIEPEQIEEVKIETEDGEEVKAEVEDGEVTEVTEEPKSEEPNEEVSNNEEPESTEVGESALENDETPSIEENEEKSEEDEATKNYKEWEEIYNKEVKKN